MENTQLAESFTIEGERFQLKTRCESDGMWAGILYTTSCSIRCPDMRSEIMRTRACIAGAAQMVSEFPENHDSNFDLFYSTYEELEEHYDTVATRIDSLEASAI